MPISLFRRTEESLKTEADQQKIIHKYKNHKVKTDYDGGNFFDYDGVFMTLHSLAKEGAEKDLAPQSTTSIPPNMRTKSVI